ncbi:DNA-binding response regulator [Salinimicrobium marinum]|uniref:DNA-binding response regulator n=1 Tax=Salinimicrobium marinum TaxID=680283 RepID=A0A918S6R9_9FLAO|nr:LytTR family DNA-binding domain-containing protein [Salinimicrobium marinum]GHA27144.1 DNA-binding response regulator [Salinimicrobium marinum]
MRALIIDDEETARKRVSNLLNKVPEIDVVGECSTGKLAIEHINVQKPDLILLDTDMKDISGFEVLSRINHSPRPIVVLMTSRTNEACKAFDVNACDFLLKPFTDERFFMAVNKVLLTPPLDTFQLFENKMQELFRMYTEKTKANTPSLKIPVKQGNKTVLLDPPDIYYIISSGYYAEIYTKKNKYVLRVSLNTLDEMLDREHFFRMHRSTIVNIDHVKEIVHSEYGEIDAKMTDGKLLHTSKSHKKDFLEKLGI